MTAPRLDARGLTLIELLVALLIVGFLTTAAFSFVRQQEQAFSLGVGRADVMQNQRFALELLDQNIRTAGTGTVDAQPLLVYAGEDAFVFNADYASNDRVDAFSVYVDPDAPAGGTGSLTRARRLKLPRSEFWYPSVDYSYTTVTGTSAPSAAETIALYFEPDPETRRTDDFVLYRQVNDEPPAVVARSLLRTPGRPFFGYDEEVALPGGATRIESVSGAALPLWHGVAQHRAPADTGRASGTGRIDRVRAVRVSFTASDGRTGALEQRQAVQRLIRMPNTAQAALKTCGDEPQFASGVTAAWNAASKEVRVSWSAAADESGGEKDVVRYVIFRRLATASGADWGEAYFSVPAGQTGYLYSDQKAAAGTSYRYAVAAQDCTPSVSVLRTSNAVDVPPEAK